jgi:hypothetical protein
MNTMRNKRHQESDKSEKGVALLISIFALMLISAVALSLVLMSGTGSAIDANYRNSTKAFYNSYAGLEEARGRLAPSHPNSILAGLPNPLSVSPTIQVQYIINPAAGEVVAPTNLAANNPYADNEFLSEWGIPVTAPNVVVLPNINSVYVPGPIAGLNGPLYKWMRITGLTEFSAKTDVDGDGQPPDILFPIFEVSGNRYLNTPANAGLAGNQVYRISALAVMPDNSRRMLQYDVVMNTLNLNFPSALTMAGPIGSFNGANSNQYCMDGNDGATSTVCPVAAAPPVPGCTANQAPRPAIGLAGGSTSSISLPRPGNYSGLGGTGTPTVQNVSLNTALNTTSSLDQTLQLIQQNATALLPNPPPPPGPITNTYTFSNVVSALPGGTWPNSPTNPQIIYVDGNFDLGPNTGSGILVVTGNFTYTGNSGWNGIILVVGQGTTTFLGSGGGNGQFNGAIFAATTRDSSGNQLSSFGTVNFDISGGGGNGVYFNSCWISNAQNSLKKFDVLSFRELLNF